VGPSTKVGPIDGDYYDQWKEKINLYWVGNSAYPKLAVRGGRLIGVAWLPLQCGRKKERGRSLHRGISVPFKATSLTKRYSIELGGEDTHREKTSLARNQIGLKGEQGEGSQPESRS